MNFSCPACIAGVRGSIDPQNAAGLHTAVAGDALSSAVFAQLLLDMHRHIGVMLLDRMGAGETNCFTQHLEAATKVRTCAKQPRLHQH